LLAFVKTISWTQRAQSPLCVQTQTKGFGDGREFGGLRLLLHSHDCAAALLFRTGPVEQVDWANPIADCSGYSDRISPA
jgi:hypothetical protein